MNQGTTILSQVFSFFDYEIFRSCVRKYQGDHRVRSLSCWEQFLAMSFAQLTWRESLRDIEVSLAAHRSQLYHSGFRSPIKRSTLADANEQRDWRIYAEFAQHLIHIARPLYAGTDLGITLDATLYALDSTVIDLCLALFPWAPYQRSKAAIKLHTLLDLKSSIPALIDITDWRGHDSWALDQIIVEPGCFIVMDRNYGDFRRLHRLHQSMAFFVLRSKSNLQYRRRCSHPINRSTGVRSDQTILLTGVDTHQYFPSPLRRVSYYASDTKKHLVFITNNFAISAETVAAIYHQRWQVELFFKWIKQHLRIKRFFGTSPNAVKTQIWISVAVYVLIAIIKKQMGLSHSLYTILQILSTSLFDKTPVQLVFQRYEDNSGFDDDRKQLKLFDIKPEASGTLPYFPIIHGKILL
jgi:hypothetical protein